MTLSTAQRDIVEKMRDGWRLSTLWERGWPDARLTKEGEVDIEIHWRSFRNLFDKGVFFWDGKRADDGRVTYELTEQGRTIETLEKT